MINERIKSLRTQKGITQAKLALELGIAKTTLAAYEQGKNEPSNETLIKIANYFDVSTDYLLGITNVQATNLNIAFIAKYLGLTERAINELHCYNKLATQGNIEMQQKIDTLNLLFTPSCELLENITAYLQFSATHFKNFYNDADDALSPISDLELWDDIAKSSYSDDWDLWSKAFLLIVEDELTELRKTIQSKKWNEYHKLTLNNVKPPTTE